jgi:predicted amidohydrolase YtcJ
VSQTNRNALALFGAPVWCGPHVGVSGNAIGFGQDGRIAAIGTKSQVLAALPRGCQRVDVRECLVAPGFVDAHVHVASAVAMTLRGDCSRARSRAEVLKAVGDEATRTSGSRWVALAGLEPALIADGLPTPAQLDAAAGGRPVRLRLRSLHGWLLGAAAIRKAKLAGHNDGLVADHTGSLRDSLGPKPSRVEFSRSLGEWSEARLRDGIVALVDASYRNGIAELKRYRAWHRFGHLRQEVVAFTGQPVRSKLGVVGTKIMAEPNPHLVIQLSRSISQAWELSQLAAVHCADLETLGALIEVVEEMDPRRRGRLRIEHAAVTPPEWLQRIARLPATVVTHPAFIREHGDRYLADPDAGPHEWLYRLRSWLDHGVQLAFGSDSPAGPAQPCIALEAALSRKTALGMVIGSTEALRLDEALACLTAWPAVSSGLPHFGTLTVRGLGHAVVLAPGWQSMKPSFRIKAVVHKGRLL